MRFLISLSALALLVVTGRADEPKKYYLVDGTVTEMRVADLEARVAELEKRLTTASAKLQGACGKTDCGSNCSDNGCVSGCKSAGCIANGCVVQATPSRNGLPTRMTINGVPHELRSDGSYWPASSPAQFGGTFTFPGSSGCANGKCPTPR